jgi:hypothetical protein
MKLKISYTYDVVTPESAEHGDFAETGWAYFNGCNLEPYGPDYDERCSQVIEVTFKEDLYEFLNSKLFCWEKNFDVQVEGSYYGTEPDIDYHDGSETRFCAHVDLIK